MKMSFAAVMVFFAHSLLLTQCIKVPFKTNAAETKQDQKSLKVPDWLEKYPEVGRPITLAEYKSNPMSQYEEEEMYLVRGAQVVIADYAALRRDFAFPESATDADLDDFLLDNFAVISKKHVEYITEKKMRNVSTTMSFLELPEKPGSIDSRPGIRPAKYGRAHLIPVDRADIADPKNYREKSDRDTSTDVLFDIKGSGAVEPQPISKNDHGNGLMFLYEGMREYTYQKIVELIFDKESRLSGDNTSWSTIPTYAVIDLGFEIYLPGGFESEAGIIVRRSHFRLGQYSNASAEPTYEKLYETRSSGREAEPVNFIEKRSERPAQQKQIERILAQELALRKYGFTSTAVRFPFGKASGLSSFFLPESSLYDDEKVPVDIVNIQVTRTMEVIDFGPYNFLPEFKRPLVLGKPQDENPYGGGRTGRTPEYWVSHLAVGEPRFVQPQILSPGMEKRFGRNILAFGENAAFLDNMSAVYFFMGQGQMIGMVNREQYLGAHCNYMNDVLKQVGLEASSHTSSKNCPRSGSSEGFMGDMFTKASAFFSKLKAQNQ